MKREEKSKGKVQKKRENKKRQAGRVAGLPKGLVPCVRGKKGVHWCWGALTYVHSEGGLPRRGITNQKSGRKGSFVRGKEPV